MSKPTIALQLYTVRDFATKDLPDTLSQVKAMGYDAVELAGTYGLSQAEFKKLLDDTGLEAISAHVPIAAFEKDAAGTAAMYKALGCKLVSVPSLPDAALPGGEGFDATKATMAKAAACCKELGMKFGYHNHDYEFKTLPCGSFKLDALFDAMETVLAQIDVGWVAAAGQDPVPYVQKYAGRCPSIHLKDIVMPGGKVEDRPVGQGSLDVPAIMKAAADVGADIIVVELDDAHGMTSLEAARQSREYLKTLGH